jgi:hypothetical protein
MYQDIARRLVRTSATESSRSGDVGIRDRRRLLRLHRTCQYLARKSKPTRAAYHPGRPSNRHTYCCRSLGCRARCSPIGTSLCSMYGFEPRRTPSWLPFDFPVLYCRALAPCSGSTRTLPARATPISSKAELGELASSVRGSTRAGLRSLLQVEMLLHEGIHQSWTLKPTASRNGWKSYRA